MYSRKPEEEVWQNYRDLQVDYAILEDNWCSKRRRYATFIYVLYTVQGQIRKFLTGSILRSTCKRHLGAFLNTIYHRASMYELKLMLSSGHLHGIL